MRNEKWKTNFSLLISLFFEPLVGLDIRKACWRQAYKEESQHSSESKLSLTAGTLL